MQRTPLRAMTATAFVTATMVFASAGAAGPEPIRLPDETVQLKPSTLPGFAIAQQKCTLCHSADYIAYQPPGMTVAQWTAEMTKMQHLYGAPIDAQEIRLLGVYLAATYGDAASVTAEQRAMTATAPADPVPVAMVGGPPAAGGTIDVQALLDANACLSCHAVAQKIVGPAYRDVAAKYRSDGDAVARLEASIKAGGAGRWGPVAMPAFGQLTDAQLKALAEFVMTQ